jgi:adenine deaminase
MTGVMSLTHILTDKYFDSALAEIVQGSHVIKVDTSHGLILGVHKASEVPDSSPSSPNVIDLRGLTVLPGFVDTHVHRELSHKLPTSAE